MAEGGSPKENGPWGPPYTIFKWVILARSVGARCVFLVGAGPLTKPLSKFFVRRELLAADYVSLRDNKSQVLVQRIGFTGESRVYPDSASSSERRRSGNGQSIGRGSRTSGFSGTGPGGTRRKRIRSFMTHSSESLRVSRRGSFHDRMLSRFLALTLGLIPMRFRIFRALF